MVIGQTTDTASRAVMRSRRPPLVVAVSLGASGEVPGGVYALIWPRRLRHGVVRNVVGVTSRAEMDIELAQSNEKPPTEDEINTYGEISMLQGPSRSDRLPNRIMLLCRMSQRTRKHQHNASRA